MAGQSRQLAAIMFTDIVGYTALMGKDEQKAFELLNKNRQIQKPIIEQFNGRWIKELGDGVMASFNTVSDAVYAAVKIQETCNASKEFQLRIGVHLGDVLFENDDVFGDGVNIASRIQAIATPGCIYVSESVYNNISNKKDIQTKFIKEVTLKNVKEAIRIYEVMITSNAYMASENKMKDSSQNSIAVLPFANMSSDPEQEYFSDGMAEEILNSLSHLKDLKVAGRTSSFQFKGKNLDLREVGEKLGVKTVLEGSVRKQGNHIRITAQLIAVDDGFHLWSEKYDRTMDDIFAIQDEIALSITEQLKITLFENDRKFITKTATQNAEAYELYLKGKFYLSRRGSSVITALNFFKQSMEVDPDFALAHAGYSEASIYSAFYSYISGKEVMNQVKLAAETARKLDSSLCEPYISLGHYYLNFEWNWVEAQKNYTKAIEINPKHAQAHNLYGMLYLAWAEGKFDEAEAEGQIALKLEPLSAVDHADLAWTLWTAYRFEEALTFANKGIELDANSFLSHRLAGFCYLALKRYEEAIDTFDHLMKISNRHQHALNPLIWCYCSNGDLQKASVLMKELETRSVTEYIAGTHFGISAAYLGDLDTAFNYLEKACRDYDPVLIQLKYSPFVPESLRSDTRFQNILDWVGFPK